MLIVNQATLDTIGKPAADVLGRNEAEWHDDPQQAAAIIANDRRIMSSGSAEPVEEVFTSPGGEPRIFAGTKSPLRDAAGKVIGIVGVQRDVTALKQAEERLRTSEEKYRNLFENMAEEVHFWKLVRDEAGGIKTWRLMDVNPPVLKTWNRNSVDEIQGKTADEIFGAGATDHYMPVVQKIFASGEPHTFEDYFPNLGKYFRFTSVPFGEFFITTGADITAIKKVELALRQSEERLRMASESAQIGIWDCDLTANELRWDERTRALFGLSPDASVSYDVFLAGLHPDDRDTTHAAVQQALDSTVKGEYDIEYRTVGLEDGITRWIHAKGKSYFENGQAVRFIGTVLDITTRKEAEDALRRNAETFAALVEQAPLGIYTVDLQFRIRNVSTGAMPAFRNVQPLIGRDFEDAMRILWPEPFASEAIRIFRHTLETGEPYRSQGLTEKRNDIGTSELYEWQVNRVTLTDGEYGVVCYYYDTTRLQQAFQAVRESEERLRFSLHAASAGAWEWDILSDKSTWSPENYALFDLEPAAHNASYANWEARIHPEDREAANQQIRDVMDGRDAEFRAEFRVVRRDGSVRWLAGFGKVERSADGAASRMSGINIDITERKRDEEHIQLLMREVNHRSKNMLSLVQSIAHLTASTGPKDFVQRFGERIRSLSAAQDLLIKHEWQAVPLADLVRSQLSHFADLIGGRISLSGPAVSISQGASQTIGMALHELATNAAKYGALSNKSGSIAIEWDIQANGSTEPQFLLCWLERDGPPVAKPRRRGFGSKVTSGMVEGSVGGEVLVDYAPSGLVWRLACPAGNIIDGGSPTPSLDKPSVRAASGRRVLVVEDEPLIAAEIATTLELAGFKIVGPAGSVSLALALMNGDGCDAAVLDVNLGHETSEPIARGLMNEGKPFVVVSGYTRAQMPQIFRAAPLIGKPLSPAVLEAEIKRLVTNAAPRRLHS